MSLWMAILLTALSVHATPVKTFDIVDTNATTQKQVDAVSFGKAVTYFIDSSQQEIIGENERESLPLSLDDSPFFFTPNKYSSNTFLGVLENNRKIAPENASFSKLYTKQILFPFHSHW